jgi:hypothetical protein
MAIALTRVSAKVADLAGAACVATITHPLGDIGQFISSGIGERT